MLGEITFLKNCVETSKTNRTKTHKKHFHKKCNKKLQEKYFFFAPNHHLTTTFVAFRCLMLWLRHLPIFIKNFFCCFIFRTIFVRSLWNYERDDVTAPASSSTTTSNGSFSGCSRTGKLITNSLISVLDLM